VLVADVIMPGGLTGKEVADHFRMRRPTLPVIFVSGYSGDIVSAASLTEDERAVFVQKPFEEDALLDAIARASGMTAVVGR